MPNNEWTQSYAGKKTVLRALKAEEVSFEDIPQGLSSKVRFAGQIKRGPRSEIYTVAQHCVQGALMLPRAFQLPFLMHEAGEVYLPDMPGPLKSSAFIRMPGEPKEFASELSAFIPWEELEAQHCEAILERLGLTSILPLVTCKEVRDMDLAMLEAERISFHKEPPEPWGLPFPPPPALSLPMQIWSCDEADSQFRMLFEQLAGFSL